MSEPLIDAELALSGTEAGRLLKPFGFSPTYVGGGFFAFAGLRGGRYVTVVDGTHPGLKSAPERADIPVVEKMEDGDGPSIDTPHADLYAYVASLEAS